MAVITRDAVAIAPMRHPPGADPGVEIGGPYGERGARSYNGGLGTVPPAGPGAEPLVRGLRGEAPEAERFLVLSYV